MQEIFGFWRVLEMVQRVDKLNSGLVEIYLEKIRGSDGKLGSVSDYCVQCIIVSVLLLLFAIPMMRLLLLSRKMRRVGLLSSLLMFLMNIRKKINGESIDHINFVSTGCTLEHFPGCVETLATEIPARSGQMLRKMLQQLS
ncbi:hypothetical protein L195_g005916 [Trifolium pratense]|uniref:Uncharacterized protein n=1 Tax=Trifolium pratense TaxID=57577 RepID=A0A2K3P244_TRIPR|nr:hypothetical protein L195_g005916 [Trifolium pratense]